MNCSHESCVDYEDTETGRTAFLVCLDCNARLPLNWKKKQLEAEDAEYKAEMQHERRLKEYHEPQDKVWEREMAEARKLK